MASAVRNHDVNFLSLCKLAGVIVIGVIQVGRIGVAIESGVVKSSSAN